MNTRTEMKVTPLSPTMGPCGVFDCGNCQPFQQGQCSGCRAENMRRLENGEPLCGVFRCVQDRGLTSCVQCDDSPCPFESLDEVSPVCGMFMDAVVWRPKVLEHLIVHGHRFAEERERTTPVVPERTLLRLRWYLLALDELAHKGARITSSQQLAERVGVKATLVRKDLGYFGHSGTPSVGYRVISLRDRILRAFGMQTIRQLAWVGAGRLIGDPELFATFRRHHCVISAVFDPDPALLGARVGELQVMDMDMLGPVVRNLKLDAGVVAVPEARVVEIGQALVEAGIKVILNLTAVPLRVPEDVCVTQADLGTQIYLLSYHCRLQRMGQGQG